MQSQIPCPQCGGNIILDTHLLLAGQKFSCQQCHAQVGLSPQSQPDVAQAVQGFEALQRQKSQVANAAQSAVNEL